MSDDVARKLFRNLRNAVDRIPAAQKTRQYPRAARARESRRPFQPPSWAARSIRIEHD